MIIVLSPRDTSWGGGTWKGRTGAFGSAATERSIRVACENSVSVQRAAGRGMRMSKGGLASVGVISSRPRAISGDLATSDGAKSGRLFPRTLSRCVPTGILPDPFPFGILSRPRHLMDRLVRFDFLRFLSFLPPVDLPRLLRWIVRPPASQLNSGMSARI